jgi:HK97 family phage portal protein
MAFFDRFLDYFRSTSTLANPAPWLFDALGARPSAAGINVTPENSLEVTSVWAAVRMISSTLATIPLRVYRHTNEGKEVDRHHPIYRLLHDRPNPEMSSFVYREVMAAHLLLFGAHYSEIELNGKGEPVALWPIYPSSVRITRLTDGSKLYMVIVDGQEVALPAERVLHIPGFSLDGVNGLIPIHMGREAIGGAKGVEQFGNSFFGRGAVPLTAITVPTGNLSEEQKSDIRKGWAGQHGGTAVLTGGMTANVLGIAPEHAQMLETRKFSVTEVARLFLIPPPLLMDLERATFSNIEHQAMQYVTHCIAPWAKRIESELNYRLFTDASRFAEFDLRGLMRGDSAARAAYYREMVNLGVMSINEVRALENMNAIEGGDMPRVQLNTVAIDEEDNDEG